MTICGVDTFIIFDPMTHSRQSYVLTFSFSLKFKLIKFERKGIPGLGTMDQMALAHSSHNTRATTFVLGSNLANSQKGKLKVLEKVN